MFYLRARQYPNIMLIYFIKGNEAFILHAIMISEGSCDTEDWSNDAENSGLIKGYSNRKVILNCNISQYYCIY